MIGTVSTDFETRHWYGIRIFSRNVSLQSFRKWPRVLQILAGVYFSTLSLSENSDTAELTKRNKFFYSHNRGRPPARLLAESLTERFNSTPRKEIEREEDVGEGLSQRARGSRVSCDLHSGEFKYWFAALARAWHPRNRLRQQQPAGRDPRKARPSIPDAGAFFGVESVLKRIIACLQCTARGYAHTPMPGRI